MVGSGGLGDGEEGGREGDCVDVQFPEFARFILDEREVFGDGGGSGAEFGIENGDEEAEEAIRGGAHAIFVPFPFRNPGAIGVDVATELVTGEAEVVAEKAELFAVEATGTVGESLGDGAVDYCHAWDDDILIAAVGAIRDIEAL